MKSRPWQRRLKPGDFAWRPYLFMKKPGFESIQPIGTYVDIFMEIIRSPYAEDRAKLADMPEHRMVNAFSAVIPGGPEGDHGQIVPVWCMVPITEALWREARQRTWQVSLRGLVEPHDKFGVTLRPWLVSAFESNEVQAIDYRDGKARIARIGGAQ